MEKSLIYLDTAATTKPYEEAAKEVYEVMLNNYGNPSSINQLGVEAEKKLEESREKIAKTLNAAKEEIVFTSGASEGNNFLIKAFSNKNCNIITMEIEHPSVLNTYRALEEEGVEVRYIKISCTGHIDFKELEEAIDKNTVLVTIAHVNNEVGTIQNLEKIGEIIKGKSSRAKFHVDAAQSYGKIPIDIKKSKIDVLTASGHKFKGPKGAGFVYIKKGLVPKAHIVGGGQEKGFRSGTENLPAISGMALAAELSCKNMEENFKKAKEIKTYLMEKLKTIDNIIFNSDDSEEFSPYILNVSFLGVRGEVLLHALEGDNIYVSTGSACSSKKLKAKKIVNYLGRNEKEAEGAIRFSFHNDLTKEDMDYVVEKLKRSLTFLRRVKR